MEQSDILRNLRIEQLTPMQEAARDAYQSDKDLVLLSPTGSGKTLAIPAAAGAIAQSRCAGRTGGGARTVARACLADRKRIQVDERPFQGDELLRRRPAMDEHRTMRGINPAVIIGTPGRMNDHCGSRTSIPAL